MDKDPKPYNRRMAPASPAYVDADYRRLSRHATGQRLRAVLDLLAAAAPGAAFGLWLMRDVSWDYPAVLVAVACGAGTAAAVARLRRILGRRPADAAAARLVRSRCRGERAVVTPPPTNAGKVRGTMIARLTLLNMSGAGLGALLVMPLAAVAGARLLTVTTIAATLLLTGPVSPVQWLRGPTVAMFADRLEVRRRSGRYVVAWQDIVRAEEQYRHVQVSVTSPAAVARKGWVRRAAVPGFRFEVHGVPAAAVVGAIEHHRQQRPRERRADIVLSARPRVVDDGGP